MTVGTDDRNFILAEISLNPENVINNDHIYGASLKVPHGNTAHECRDAFLHDGGLWGCEADRSICWRWEREQKRYCYSSRRFPQLVEWMSRNDCYDNKLNLGSTLPRIRVSFTLLRNTSIPKRPLHFSPRNWISHMNSFICKYADALVAH